MRDIQMALDFACKRITEMFGAYAEQVILYGSYARGDFDEESDVDIAILLNLSREESAAYNKLLARLMTELSLNYDLLVNIACIPMEEFKHYREILPYYRNIDREGVRLSADCLIEKLGVVDTEQFISAIMREKFDYTTWQRRQFDNISSDDFNAAAVAYAKENPFTE